MATTNPRDREIVRSALRQCVPSGFPQGLDPLTVGSVACHLHNEWQSGRLDIFVWEKPIVDRLLTDATPLPVDLNEQSLRSLLASVGVTEGTFETLFSAAVNELIAARAENYRAPHPRAF